MQNLGFVYELYVFNTYKVLGIIFKAHDFVSAWITDTQWVKAILLIAQKSHLSSFLIIYLLLYKKKD